MLTSIRLKNSSLLDRVQRDPLVPLTRVTVLAGPNGSGKSTIIDALRGYCLRRDVEWTEETAPVDVAGSCTAVYFASTELDNPRLNAKRGADGRQVHPQQLNGFDLTRYMICSEMSHGQSNHFQLDGLFENDAFDVMVLDEPENALDLDGLGWLYKAIQKTAKQIIIVTHNPLLLKLKDEVDGSVQVFGSNPDYAQRVLDVYAQVISGGAFGKVEKRRKNQAIPTGRGSPALRKHFGLDD